MELLRECLFVQDAYVLEKLKEHSNDKRYQNLVSFFVSFLFYYLFCL